VLRHGGGPDDSVPQFGIHPDVVEAGALPCRGGPCDGQEMRCPTGRVLIIVNAVDGMRAVSLPPEMVAVSKGLGGYVGHYEPAPDRLAWVPAATPEVPDAR
jgi:hypothetical protein